jgi:hypothetical protein
MQPQLRHSKGMSLLNTFCSKCGAEVPSGSTFCPTCGAPVGAVAPAASAPIPSPAYPPAPPPTTSSGSALKIILIIVGVFVLLGIAAAGIVGYGAWRVSRAVRMESNGEGVSVSTPGGTITTGRASSISESDLGAPVYPGAARSEGSMNIKSPSGSMITAIYTTNDPLSKVVEFYKSKLGPQASIMETGNGTMLTSGGDEKDKLLITITSDEGKTKIAIVHSTHTEK